MAALVLLYTFQLTTSRRGRQVSSAVLACRERQFQLTTSRRGRLHGIGNALTRMYFNSLPHAEVDYTPYPMIGILTPFQLTTSRRGRRCSQVAILSPTFYFNSLPHAEVDCVRFSYLPNQAYFNSLPHAEVDSNLSQNLWTLTIDSITNRIINLCFLL